MKIWAFSILTISCSESDPLSRVCPSICIDDEEPDEVQIKKYAKHMGIGSCRWGVPVCEEDGKIVKCDGFIFPEIEVCDSIDNDCDGKIDEDLVRGPTSYYQGGYECKTVGECAFSRMICIGGKYECIYPDTVEYPKETRCDGLDNDCDGLIDEDLFSGYCYTGPAGTENNYPCHPGVLSCNGGQISCLNEFLPGVEICGDGIDNNCNGITDDGDVIENYDIVLSIDMSGSMVNDIWNIVGGFTLYLSYLSVENFKFALIYTGLEEFPYMDLISDFTDANSIRNILSNIASNSMSGFLEPTIDAIYRVCDLSNNLFNLSWRPNATPIYVGFTDEEAQSYLELTEADALSVCLNNNVLVYHWDKLPDFDFVFQTGGQEFDIDGGSSSVFEGFQAILIEDICQQ